MDAKKLTDDLARVERYIISTLLSNYADCIDIALSYGIDASRFSDSVRQGLFKELIEQKGTATYEIFAQEFVGVDVGSLPFASQQRHDELVALGKHLPQSKTTFEEYCKDLIRLCKEGYTFNTYQEINNALLSGASIDDLQSILDRGKENISSVEKKTGWYSKRELIDSYYKKLQEVEKAKATGVIGLDYGFAELNKKTLGLQKGQLIIVGAGTSIGKTAFSLSLVTNFLKKKYKGLFISTEMPASSLLDRLLAQDLGVELNLVIADILNEEQRTRRHDFVKHKLDYIAFCDKALNLDAVENQIIQAKRAGFEYVIIDYLQMIGVDTGKRNSTRAEEVSTITKRLKRLALDYDIPIIALSQLSRASKMRENGRPQLSDLRESGAIEQDADCVFLIYRAQREELNNLYWMLEKTKQVDLKDNTLDNSKQQSKIKKIQERIDEINLNKMQEKCEVVIAKNRQGECSVVDIYYNAPLTLFFDRTNEIEFSYKPADKDSDELFVIDLS